MPILDKYCRIAGASIFKDYACTLNQADVEHNKNKFYIIQLIQRATNYYVWARYGRTGEIGANRCETFTQEHEAVKAFCKRYYEKTGNRWGVDPFIKKDKYDEIELEEPEVVVQSKTQSLTKISKLDPRVES